MSENYQICSRCIIDTTVPETQFGEEGVCSYCRAFEREASTNFLKGEAASCKLHEIAGRIRSAGKNKKYDSILGLSGGTDSTYLAYLAGKLGLRPLVVHLDNGWNSELAVKNIEQTVKKLGFDLFTYVIDWEEFKDLQLAYLQASVVDIEVLTDHAIFACLYRLAMKKRIPYVLVGNNTQTEMTLPRQWIHSKMDAVNIRDIHKQYGKGKLRTFPFWDMWRSVLATRLLGLRIVPLLDYADYHKPQARKVLEEALGWKDYGGKHCESLFTKFYQCYILPEKFKIDKRRAHLSNLVQAGQMTREEALREIARPIYDPDERREDKIYVLKKFGLTEEAFDAIMRAPERRHEDFMTSAATVWEAYPFLKFFRPLFKRLRSFKKRQGG